MTRGKLPLEAVICILLLATVTSGGLAEALRHNDLGWLAIPLLVVCGGSAVAMVVLAIKTVLKTG